MSWTANSTSLGYDCGPGLMPQPSPPLSSIASSPSLLAWQVPKVVPPAPGTPPAHFTVVRSEFTRQFGRTPELTTWGSTIQSQPRSSPLSPIKFPSGF